jgi:UDP-N-acetylmuramate dehydrogenase
MNNTISKGIEKIKLDQLLQQNFPLAHLSTYQTGGEADYFASPKNLFELKALIKWAKEQNLPITTLGGGSNVLIADDGVEGLVISTLSLTAFHIRGLIFCVQSGLLLDTAINIAIENSLSGLELLGGLPGTVGGGIWGNAEAHNLAISDLIEWVDYLDEDGNLLRLNAYDKNFSYKKSPFMDKFSFIYEIAFRLIPNKNTSEARLQKEKSRTKRIAAGQFDWPSSGCFFKNPKGISVGKLIDEANLKNLNYNGAYVSSHHGNFIVKKSEKTKSSDIFYLSQIVAQKIEESYNLNLMREVILIGRWNI